MKKVFYVLLAMTALSSGKAFGQGKTNLAVYVQGNADSDTRKIVGSEFTKTIVDNSRYAAVERTDEFLAVLKREKDYQYSGSVDDGQLIKLGKQLGVKMVCAVDVSEYGSKHYIISRMIDVDAEKGLVVSAAGAYDFSYSVRSSNNGLDYLMERASDVAEELLKNVTTTAGKQKIAIYVTKSSEYYSAKKASSKLIENLTSSGAFITVERTSDFLAVLQQAQGYEQTGNVDDKQLSQLGRQFGANLVCVVDILGNGYTSMRVINAETSVIMAAASDKDGVAKVDEMTAALLQRLGACTKKNQKASKLLKCCDGLVEVNGVCRDPADVRKTTAALNVTANTWASVYVDGEDKGRGTSVTVKDVPYGTRSIRLSADGYKDYYTSITVNRPQNQPYYVHGRLKVDNPFLFYELRGSKTAPLGLALGYCNSWGGYAGVKSGAAFLPVQKVSASFVKEADLSALDYSDRKYDRFAVTGGGMVRLAGWLYLYGGAGYGKYGEAYKVAETDNDYYSPNVQKGVEAELGAMLRLWHFNLSAGYSTIFATGSPQRFSDVQLGVGLNLSGDFVENIYRGKEIEGKDYRRDYGLFLLENRMSKTAPYGFVIGGGGGGDFAYGAYYLHSSWGDRYYTTLGLMAGSSPLCAYGGIGLGNSKYSKVSWKAAFQWEYGLRVRLPFVNFSAGRSHMWGFAEWHFGAGFAIPFL